MTPTGRDVRALLDAERRRIEYLRAMRRVALVQYVEACREAGRRPDLSRVLAADPSLRAYAAALGDDGGSS